MVRIGWEPSQLKEKVCEWVHQIIEDRRVGEVSKLSLESMIIQAKSELAQKASDDSDRVR